MQEYASFVIAFLASDVEFSGFEKYSVKYETGF